MQRSGRAFETLRGRFIVIDGPDGAGKTAVRARVAQDLERTGLTVTQCRDPGGTRIGDRVRGILLDHDLSGMDVHCETLLFMASRAQLVSEVIRPALKAGHVVLCDRFVSATCAYQVAAGGDHDSIVRLAHYAIGTTWPHLTVILDVPPEVGFERIGRRIAANQGQTTGDGSATALSAGLDGMERRPRSFHEAVRQYFLELQVRYPAPVKIIDATRSLDAVLDDFLALLDRLAVCKL